MAWYIQQRYLLAFMAFLAFMMAVSLRSFIGIVLTQMVKVPNLKMTAIATTNTTLVVSMSSASIAHEEICPSDEIVNEDISIQDNSLRYGWSQKLQGIILSSYYWGSITTQIPSSILATHYGGKYVILFGLLTSSILTLLTPLAVQMGEYYALITIRLLMGLSQGGCMPAISAMLAAWIPLKERGRIASLLFSGIPVCLILTTNTAAIIIHTFRNWSIVFYVFGSVVILWCLLFSFLCYNDFETHPFISDEEKEYLRKEMLENEMKMSKQKTIPWKAMLTSTPIIVLCIASILGDFCYYIITTDLSKYINDVLHIPILKNGLYSTLPNVAGIIVTLISGWVCDWMISKKGFSVTFTRKLFVGLGAVFPAIFLVSGSYAGCDRLLVLCCLMLTVGTMGFNSIGIFLNAMDLSPNYASVLEAMSIGMGALAGLIAPYVVGILTPKALLTEWRIVFWIIAAVLVAQVVIFTIWGSAKVQPWNAPKKKSTDNA